MNILILESNKVIASLIKANLEKYVFFANCDVIDSFEKLKNLKKEYDLYITSDILNDSDKEHLNYLKDKKYILITNSENVDNNAIDYIRKSDISILNYLVKLVKRIINNKFINVLLIEKDDSLREYKKNILEKINLNLTTSKYLRDALRIIKKNNVNFLIINIDSNDLDVITFIKNVRELYNYYELPIIIISDIENMSKTIEALKFGANTFIQKPFIKESLLIKLNNILEMYSFDIAEKKIFCDEELKLYNSFYLNFLEDFSKTINQKSVAILQVNKKDMFNFIKKIKNKIRKNDSIIKYDENKLVLFMPNTTKKEAYVALSKLDSLNISFEVSLSDEGETLAEITKIALDRLKNKKEDYALIEY